MLLDVEFSSKTERKKHQKMPNYTLYKTAITDFRTFWFLSPHFFRNKCLTIFFYTYPENRKMFIIDLCGTNMCTKFQANIFIFGRARAQKQSNCYDVTFLKLDFDISNYRATKQMTFFGILRQNWTRQVRFNFFQGLTFFI